MTIRYFIELENKFIGWKTVWLWHQQIFIKPPNHYDITFHVIFVCSSKIYYLEIQYFIFLLFGLPTLLAYNVMLIIVMSLHFILPSLMKGYLWWKEICIWFVCTAPDITTRHPTALLSRYVVINSKCVSGFTIG